MLNFFLTLLFFLLMMTTCRAENYFLCGPDEDGCSPSDYSSCLCMPFDGPESQQPYCLDFNEVACIPLQQQPQCLNGIILNNQSECLATAFQSEPEPPCQTADKSFCQKHHIPLCKRDGGQNSCH